MLGLSLLGLIPKVDHMELFAASSGSSILSVLGTQGIVLLFLLPVNLHPLNASPRSASYYLNSCCFW
jgi:hypothetical protein